MYLNEISEINLPVKDVTWLMYTYRIARIPPSAAIGCDSIRQVDAHTRLPLRRLVRSPLYYPAAYTAECSETRS